MDDRHDVRELLDSALEDLRADSRVGSAFAPHLSFERDGALAVEAEVEKVAAKRLALRRIAAVPGVTIIIDRLHVTPAEQMRDRDILEHVWRAYIQEPSFLGFRICSREGDDWHLIREGQPERLGEIRIEVADSIVTLSGFVPSLASMRLAGVLAWWVPGSRDVINGIAVEPEEEDGPVRIEEAIRIALEKDRLVEASQVRVGVDGRTVHLAGLTSSLSRASAENDAWYVTGIDDVVNDIKVPE